MPTLLSLHGMTSAAGVPVCSRNVSTGQCESPDESRHWETMEEGQQRDANALAAYHQKTRALLSAW
eukprot:scaffold953_cov141-Cylindrotheca_fusiformis.AAC.7